MRTEPGAALIGLLALALAACSAVSPQTDVPAFTTGSPTTFRTNASGLRIAPPRNQGGPVTVCNAFTYGEGAVHGVLRISMNDVERVWIERDDGVRVSVAWPMDYVLEPGPPATIYGDAGKRLGSDGDPITLQQTPIEIASGTPNDPYRPTDCDFYR